MTSDPSGPKTGGLKLSPAREVEKRQAALEERLAALEAKAVDAPPLRVPTLVLLSAEAEAAWLVLHQRWHEREEERFQEHQRLSEDHFQRSSADLAERQQQVNALNERLIEQNERIIKLLDEIYETLEHHSG